MIMQKIRLYLALVFVLLQFPACVYGQDDEYTKKTFRLIYVAHDDEALGVGNDKLLLDALDELKMDADYAVGCPFIFYVSNGSWLGEENCDSIVAKLNVKENSQKEDKFTDDYENFVTALSRTGSHEVNADVDIENILHFLESDDFLDQSGNMIYDEVVFEFFVHQKFWDEKCNQRLISALYFILDANRYDKEKFRFLVHYLVNNPKPDFTNYETTGIPPFGVWNADGINSALPQQVNIMK